jgi:hypothetical protein
MGLFSRNENIGLGSYTIEADTSYTYPTGFGRTLAEAAQNDLAIFKGLIARDFEESAMIQEGYGGFSMEVITEGVGDIFSKIIALLKAFIAKIKGIVTSFIAKFNSVAMKDSKQYYEKYKKLVMNAKFEGCKVKFSMPKKKTGDFDGEVELDAAVAKLFGRAKEAGIEFDFAGTAATQQANNYSFDDKKVEKFNTDAEDHGFEEKFLSDMTDGMSNADFETYEKDFHELLFEDEDTLEGSSSEFSTMMSIIQNTLMNNKYVSDVEKKIRKLESEVKKIVSGFEKMRDQVLKGISSKDGATVTTKYAFKGTNDNFSDDFSFDVKGSSSDDKDQFFENDGEKKNGEIKVKQNGKFTPERRQNILKLANCQYQLTTYWQTAVLKINQAYLTEIKFHVKQCRSAYAALVSWASQPKNKIVADNSSALLTIAQEAAEYEFDSDFELA